MIAVYTLPPRYDIKGCQVSRWVDPAPEGSHLILVLKDLNFQKTMKLGESRVTIPPFRVRFGRRVPSAQILNSPGSRLTAGVQGRLQNGSGLGIRTSGASTGTW